MKIAILNECFFTKKHLARLKMLGEVSVFSDTTTEQQAIERLKDAEIGIVDQFIAPMNGKVIESSKKLKLLALNTTSFSATDTVTAKKNGIKVANVPGFSTQGVAELAIGLMFAVNRKIPMGNREMRENPFEIDPADRTKDKYLGFDLKGKTLGVIGLGKIGHSIAEMGSGLGMKVVYNTRTPQKAPGMTSVSLEELLSQSDVVVVASTLHDQTRGLLGRKQFSKMKKNAILISIASGGVIDTDALYETLKEKKIAGAGLDHVAGLKKGHPLLSLENIVLTPHSGFFTEESLQNLPKIIVENVEAFVKGQPRNVVN